MKKLFFFRSSADNGGGNVGSPPSFENNHCEVPVESGVNSHNTAPSPRGLLSKSRKQVCDDSRGSSNNSGLRRSRSLSSAAFPINGLDQKKFSASSNCSGSLSNSSSGNSSHSNTSSKVVDRYIDGEQQRERSKKKKSCSQRYFAGKNNCGGRIPSRFQCTVPALPADFTSDISRSQSFREHESACCHFSSKDWAENKFDNGSPRRLAKSVIERLSQTHISKSSAKEFGHDVPITIEDIYGGAVEKCYDVDLDIPFQNTISLEESCGIIKDCHGHATFGSQKQKMLKASFGGLGSLQNEDTQDLELQRRSKEADERIVLLSEKFKQQSFLRGSGLDVPSLVNIIRDMVQDKISLAIEVSGLLKSCIAERDSRKEELRVAREESDSRCWKLEKQKNELQSALEKELDRRSKDWSLKLEKYRLEEQRLRERVRELAEQNVSLQREISSSSERETENRSMMICSEQQISHLDSRMGELSEENKKLKQELCELQEKHAAVEENLDCMEKNYEGKDKECKEQQKSITRMLRTCNEQQKTIDGLLDRFGEEIDKGQSSNEFDRRWAKLEMEQMRLAGVELALRREVESQRLEVESLRHENIHLLKRLKANGQDLGASTLKLDKEIWTRVHCIQNQGITMLNESIDLCSKLLEHMKEKAGQLSDCKQGAFLLSKGLDGRFVVESEIKVQGFRRGTESLTRSLQTISSLLQDKCDIVALNSQPPSTSYEGSQMINQKTSVETVKSELKAEILLTSLLREKLYSKELEVELLQAELTAAARGNDFLQSEVQNALDDLSCVSHKLKDAELQMRKKDENICRLQCELQESVKELAILKGILPKVLQERDLMWEEVKQYNEKNMLLNSEVNLLKKRIEALDEDILLKEGQITILKDTLGNKPFDLLASPDTQEFLLK